MLQYRKKLDRYAIYGLMDGSKVYEIGIRSYNNDVLDSKVRQGEVIIEESYDIRYLEWYFGELCKLKEYKHSDVVMLY